MICQVEIMRCRPVRGHLVAAFRDTAMAATFGVVAVADYWTARCAGCSHGQRSHDQAKEGGIGCVAVGVMPGKGLCPCNGFEWGQRFNRGRHRPHGDLCTTDSGDLTAPRGGR